MGQAECSFSILTRIKNVLSDTLRHVSTYWTLALGVLAVEAEVAGMLGFDNMIELLATCKVSKFPLEIIYIIYIISRDA